MAEHTPGPWKFRQIDDDGLGYIEADGRDIMHAGVTDRPAAENIANSQLTAAAPELLEALEKARDTLKLAGFSVDLADASIAKARTSTNGGRDG